MNDRLPPHDLDAEQAALGGMLLSKHAIGDVAEILEPADFYQPRHETIYTAILDLYADGQPADAVTVAAHLATTGDLAKTGGAPYLHQLMSTVATAANASWHAVIVRDRAVQRRLIETGTRIAQMGWDTDNGADLAEIVDRAQAETHTLTARRATEQEPAPIDEFVAMLEEIENGRSHGLRTGFSDLDDLTDGLHPGQMIIIAGRPGMGKSTLGLDIVRHVSVRNGHPSAFFSLEMNRRELIRRATSAEARVQLHHLAPGRMADEDWGRTRAVAERLSAAPLHIDDSPDLTVMRIRTKARRLKQTTGLDLVVVDYAQLMTSGATRKSENRQTEVAAISRGMKLLARELHIPVVVLAQLNRGPVQRADKRPQMSDLRESGALEQDADVVILLHREDAYVEDSPRAGEADLIIDKHRNGPRATITVAFQGHYSRFVDMKWN